ncbi:MAG: hypothetical protein WDW36_006518 [Sanguina aurantia]
MNELRSSVDQWKASKNVRRHAAPAGREVTDEHPDFRQAEVLKSLVKGAMVQDGLVGAGIASAAVAVVGLGLALLLGGGGRGRR